MTLQTLSVSSEKPMRLVIVMVQQLAHSLAHTHTYCMHTIQSVTRDIVVESVSGLTIAIAPVLNCTLWVTYIHTYISSECSKQADLHVYTLRLLLIASTNFSVFALRVLAYTNFSDFLCLHNLAVFLIPAKFAKISTRN